MPDRPPVTVVMPFAGDPEAGRRAAAVLCSITTRPGDQLILADNSGTGLDTPGVTVVRAAGERSPAHARNVGAEHARGDWILFLDADCRAPASLIDDYFSQPIADQLGALAGEVVAATGETTLAERYGAARGFLSQRQHLAHPYLPRAVAANLLVRRSAFEQIGGFFEGLRAAEDTDFSWRLQQAGWRLELRPQARVEHRYRGSLAELRRQWRGYAAGRAWLARRYRDFAPRPAVVRAAGRTRNRRAERAARVDEPTRDAALGRLERGRFLAIDALLAGEELAGFVLSNRPAAERTAEARASVVLVADRFPVAGDPLIDFAHTLQGARVEAISRPDAVATDALRAIRVNYWEDEGVLARAASVTAVLLKHPIRSLLDLARRRPGEMPLSALAPAVRRLGSERGARVHPLGSGQALQTARRVAALAGSPLDNHD